MHYIHLQWLHWGSGVKNVKSVHWCGCLSFPYSQAYTAPHPSAQTHTRRLDWQGRLVACYFCSPCHPKRTSWASLLQHHMSWHSSTLMAAYVTSLSQWPSPFFSLLSFIIYRPVSADRKWCPFKWMGSCYTNAGPNLTIFTAFPSHNIEKFTLFRVADTLTYHLYKRRYRTMITLSVWNNLSEHWELLCIKWLDRPNPPDRTRQDGHVVVVNVQS